MKVETQKRIAPTSTQKRGRAPIGDQAMTPAERMRRCRDRFRAQGGKEFSLRLAGAHLQLVEDMAKATGDTPTEVLFLIVDEAIKKQQLIVKTAKEMYDAGATEAKVQEFAIDANGIPALLPRREEVPDQK